MKQRPREFVNNGVAAAKLGVGLPFYGYVSTGGPGVNQPRQGWPGNNTEAALNCQPRMNRESLQAGYRELMKRLYEPRNYHHITSGFGPS